MFGKRLFDYLNARINNIYEVLTNRMNTVSKMAQHAQDEVKGPFDQLRREALEQKKVQEARHLDLVDVQNRVHRIDENARDAFQRQKQRIDELSNWSRQMMDHLGLEYVFVEGSAPHFEVRRVTKPEPACETSAETSKPKRAKK